MEFLLQLSTSMMEDLPQVCSQHFELKCLSEVQNLITAADSPQPAAPGTPQHMDEQFLCNLFLFVALMIMFWLLIA